MNEIDLSDLELPPDAEQEGNGHIWRQLVEKWSQHTRLRPFKSGKHAKAKQDGNAAKKRRQKNKRERQNRKRGRK